MTAVNVILDILVKLKEEKPGSSFLESLYQQYCNRGGLSRKQLEGLYNAATTTTVVSTGQLATLEAIIKKKPVRERSAATKQVKADTRDNVVADKLNAILKKYPAHKRILFLKAKFDNNEALTLIETTEIDKLCKILV